MRSSTSDRSVVSGVLARRHSRCALRDPRPAYAFAGLIRRVESIALAHAPAALHRRVRLFGICSANPALITLARSLLCRIRAYWSMAFGGFHSLVPCKRWAYAADESVDLSGRLRGRFPETSARPGSESVVSTTSAVPSTHDLLGWARWLVPTDAGRTVIPAACLPILPRGGHRRHRAVVDD